MLARRWRWRRCGSINPAATKWSAIMRARERQGRIYAAAAAAMIVVVGVLVMCLSTTRRGQIARALTGGDASRAPPLLRRYGCAGCHNIPGIPGADGLVGPPLGDLRQRVFIAGK